MKALLKTIHGVGLSMRDVPKPIPNNGEVLIKIKKASICGTDIHIWKWDEWAASNVPVPLVVGHEYIGVIEAVGPGVPQTWIGERVSGEGHIPCDRCRNCLSGRAHICANTKSIGVNRPGAFAEYIAIPEKNIRRIPETISDSVATILDPLGNAVHTALAFDLTGEDVLITGAGPIGCMATAVCRHVGAHRIVVIDLNDNRLALAKKMGATAVFNAASWQLSDVMATLRMKEGFDVGLEMSGAQPAFKTMIDAMITGGKIALLGLFSRQPTVDMNGVIFKGLTLEGIYGRKMYETWHKTIAMLEAGLDVGPVISHQLDFENYRTGFDMMLNGTANKVLLNVG